jgi:hypothetical protein
MEVSLEIINRINELLSLEYDLFVPEEFKYITYPGVRLNKYVIGDYGTVYNIDRDIIMKPQLSDRYLHLTLSTEDDEGRGYKTFKIHRLVAWEFVEGYAPGLVVNHIDANKLHNYACNLEWCTLSENSYHGFNHDNAHSAKRSLTIEEVKYICRMFESGLSVIEVFRNITGLNGKKDDEKTYKKIVRIHTREYYKNISKNYKW